MTAQQRSAQPVAGRDGAADTADRTALRVHCFGTLRVSYGGVAVDGFESQKVLSLIHI